MSKDESIQESQMRQLREDLLDSLDEELELELDDRWGEQSGGTLWPTANEPATFASFYACNPNW